MNNEFNNQGMNQFQSNNNFNNGYVNNQNNNKNDNWKNVLIGIMGIIIVVLSALTIYVVVDKKDNSERSITKGLEKKMGIIKFTVFFMALIFIVASLPQPENSNFTQNNTTQNQEITQIKYVNKR